MRKEVCLRSYLGQKGRAPGISYARLRNLVDIRSRKYSSRDLERSEDESVLS